MAHIYVCIYIYLYIYIYMHCIYIYTDTYDICLFAYLPIWENLRHWKLPKVFNLFLTSSLLGCTSEWIQSLQIFQTYPILGKLKRPLNQWLVFGGCISSIHVYVYVHTYHNINHLLTGSCTSKWRSRAENWQVALLLNAAARAPRRLGMANLQEAMVVPIYFDGCYYPEHPGGWWARSWFGWLEVSIPWWLHLWEPSGPVLP